MRGAMKSLLLFEGLLLLIASSVWVVLFTLSLTKANGSKSPVSKPLAKGMSFETHSAAAGEEPLFRLLPKDDLSVFFHRPDVYDRTYGLFSEQLRLASLKDARDMFTFAYDGYMRYAFPLDELNPIDCVGRGPDVANP